MGKAGNYEPYTGETIATLFNLDELYKLLTKKPVTKKNAS